MDIRIGTGVDGPRYDGAVGVGTVVVAVLHRAPSVFRQS